MRNPDMTYFPGTPRRELTAKQYIAARMIAIGKQDIEAAKIAEVDRATIWRWRQIPEFQHEVDKERAEWLTGIKSQQMEEVRALKTVAKKALIDIVNKDPTRAGITSAQQVTSILSTCWKAERDLSGIKSEDTTVNVQNNIAVGVSMTGEDGQPIDGGAATVRGMREFVSEDLGIPITSIYPRVFWMLEQIDRLDVREARLCLGKGSGKTVLASVFLARQLQKLVVMPSPATYYGKIPGSKMGVINLSASGKEQAQLAIFAELRRWVKDSPWFRAYGQPSRDTGDIMEWPNGVLAMSGNSSSKGAEGISFICGAVDEVCRLPDKESAGVMSAQGLVDPVRATMLTRFASSYKMLVMSWPDNKEDYLHKEIELAKKRGVRYDLTREFLSLPISHSSDDEERRKRAETEAPFSTFPAEAFISTDGTFVLQAPTWQISAEANFDALKMEEERNPVTFASMIGARPKTTGFNGYFKDPEIVRQKANPNNKSGFDPLAVLLPDFKGSPNYVYFGHVDVGVKKDAAGIAVGHWQDGKIVYDVVLEIKPPEGGETQLTDLRQIFYDLQGRGFTFAKVTCDGFEGIGMRQEFESHGIECENFSVDKDRTPYDTWKQALYEGKLDYPDYEPIFECAKSLIDTGKKVDHTPKGKKDVLDAMAAVAFHLMSEYGTQVGKIV